MNPYKLVHRVVKFAWHHKIPVRRSAFTYCENEWPSRLDLGKQKYGGSFTVEQVEDVKAFLGILKVLVSIIPLFMLQCVSELMLPQFAMHHNFYYKPPRNNSIHVYGHMIHIKGIVHYLFLSSCLLSPLLVVSLPLFASSVHYISYSRVTEDYPEKDRSRAASDHTISSLCLCYGCGRT